MKIQIKGMVFQNIDWRKLKQFQGELKILSKKNYAKLKKSFEDKGLFVPMFVWRKKDDYYLLDGHGRERLFSEEKPTFIDANGKKTREIPCIIVEAENEKDAKEKLLVITSQFQTITQEGFDEFAHDIDDDWIKESLNFDKLFLDWDSQFGKDDVDGFFEDKEGTGDDKGKIVLKYEPAECEVVKSELKKHGETPEDAVKRLLGL